MSNHPEKPATPSLIEDANRLSANWWAHHGEQISASCDSFAAPVLRGEGLFVRQPSPRALTLLAGPRLLPERTIEQAERSALRLDDLLDRAAAFLLSTRSLRRLALGALPAIERHALERTFGSRCGWSADKSANLLGTSLYYSRLDLGLAGDPPRLVPTDTTASCPGGVHYVTALQQKYRRVLGLEPTVDMLGFVGRALIALGKQSGHVDPTIGLISAARDDDAGVEMELLHRALRFRRLGLRFVVGTIDQLRVASDGGLSLGDDRLAGVWRTWGVGFGDDDKQARAVLDAFTPMLNPPHTLVRGWPLLWALLSTDEELRESLDGRERALVDRFLPTTTLVASAHDLERVVATGDDTTWHFRTACTGDDAASATGDPEHAARMIEQGRPLVAQPAAESAPAKIDCAWFADDGQVRHGPAPGGAMVYTLHLPDGTRSEGPIAAYARGLPGDEIATGRAWGLAYSPDDLPDAS